MNGFTQPKSSLGQKIALILFGVLLSLVILETGLRLGGFVVLSIQEHRNRETIKQKGPYRIMCLGESTTQNQYPLFLEKTLNERSIGKQFSVIDRGLAGTDSSRILDALTTNLDTYRPDMVITMMGINDSKQCMPHRNSPRSKVVDFIRSFRIYKLAKLLWLNVTTGLQELRRSETLKSEPPQNLMNNDASIELGYFYRNQGELSKAEAIFRQAIKLTPTNITLYAVLGSIYRDQTRLSEAEAVLKKAVELDPKNEAAYSELAYTYQDQGKLLEAEALFKKVIELNPENDEAYGELGSIYRDQGLLSKAEVFLKKAIELSPENDDAYAELGYNYQDQGKLLEAEALFKKAADISPRLTKGYDSMPQSSELNYSPITVNNYQKLKTILAQKGIVYVCAQYPMRNLAPLKKLFGDSTGNIIFVDNETIFKEALKQNSYWDYFRDMFGGNFGHCTAKGNELLAKNIANVILREAFGK